MSEDLTIDEINAQLKDIEIRMIDFPALLKRVEEVESKSEGQEKIFVNLLVNKGEI